VPSDKEWLARVIPSTASFSSDNLNDGEHWNPLPLESMPAALRAKARLPPATRPSAQRKPTKLFCDRGPAARVSFVDPKELDSEWKTPIAHGNGSYGNFSIVAGGQHRVVLRGRKLQGTRGPPERVAAYSPTMKTWHRRQQPGGTIRRGYIDDGRWRPLGPNGRRFQQ